MAAQGIFFGLVFIFLAYLGPIGAFRCYIGSGADPQNIYTQYYPDDIGTATRCFRYQRPTCSGCILNTTNTYPNRCWDGCDDVSIKNATWTWEYGVLSDGVCSDIRTNFQQYTYYKDVICCHTDLCNAPNSAFSYRAAILPLVLCTALFSILV